MYAAITQLPEFVSKVNGGSWVPPMYKYVSSLCAEDVLEHLCP
jgi:hypothetical protein